MSRVDVRKKNNDDLNNGKLLNEIEAIGKALYVDKNASKTSSSIPRNRATSADKRNLLVSDTKLKHGSDDPSAKDKKSFWNWKPLKALSHVMNRRFNCCFTLEVHAIEGLPHEFNGLSLCVHWKRRDGELVTSPVKVIRGVAKFEEKLTHTCSVHGSRNGLHHSAKYEAKHFLLYVEVHGNPKLDLGKHRVDLTRLLPLTLEELEDEKSSGTWTTCFKVLGKGRGALMNVSFEYQVMGDNLAPTEKNVLQAPEGKLSAKTSVKYNLSDNRGSFRRAGSLPTNYKSSALSRRVEDVKTLHEVLPARVSEFSTSVDVLYQKLNEEKSDSLVDDKIDVSADDADHLEQPSCSPSGSYSSKIVNENVDTQFSVIEKGKGCLEEKVRSEDINAENDQPVDRTAIFHVISGGIEDISQERSCRADEIGKHDCNPKEKDTCTKESLLQDLESVLNHVSNLEKEGLDTPEAYTELSDQESELEDKPNGLTQSLNLDDLVDTVADEFLTMLGVEDSPLSFTPPDTEPESPRERLLREFQKEAEASGCSLFGFDIDEADVEDYDDYAPIISGWEEFCEGSEFLPDGETEYSDINPADRLQDAKINAKMMEDLETQALMEDWGLNEKAFQNSPPHNSGGFGSPFNILPKEPSELPALGENLGPIIQTKTGGFLRSMNPALFRNAKSGGKLVMQISSPVVVPAELGSGVTEILQHLSTIGLEKLSMQTKKLMPLEDITGKTMQEIAWERQNLLQEKTESHDIPSSGKKKVKGASSRKKSKKSSSSSGVDNMDSEYVSLEDLAPLAMDKIEALSIKGLKVQSGILDETHSNISSSASVGMDGAAGLQLLDVKDNETDEIDGLMGLSLTLDEWMRLDSGEIGEEQISERTSKLLAAHHANCTDLDFLRTRGKKKQGKKASRRKSGLLGNNFTVALMVQLRDPFRDFEPVGTPMLALIQVERVFVPPKPKIYSTVSEARDTDDKDDERQSVPKEETKEEQKDDKPQEEDLNAQYKISEVYVAGLKTEAGKKKVWGNTAQEQSGSRWLLANGMAKNKNPFVKSKVASKSSSLPAKVTSKPGNTLWGISARFLGN